MYLQKKWSSKIILVKAQQVILFFSGFLLFSHLHTVDCKARASVQLFMTDVALEVFGLLMLYKDLFIIKISVTVPEFAVEESLCLKNSIIVW